jgi:type II secretory pathway component PulF
MAVFEYKARDRMGQMVSGTMTANNADAVGQELSKMGHFPVKIKEEGGGSGEDTKKGGVKKEDSSLAFKKLQHKI